MRLYLVQHAQSKTEAEDPLRGLSKEGQATAAQMAKMLQRLGLKVAAIWHSDKLRARQTAEALALGVHAWEGLQQREGLAPLDDVAPIAERLQQEANDVMIVGHLPHLSKLASQLLAGSPERKIVEFQMGAAVCLGRDETGVWSLQWMLPPAVVRVFEP